MRLLLISDGADTGFGRVGRELARRFVAAGVDMRWLAINFRGRELEIGAFSKGRTAQHIGEFIAAFDADPLHQIMVPAGMAGDGMGHNLTAGALSGSLFGDAWRPDVSLTVADPRAMGYRLRGMESLFGAIRSFNYVPIEGGPLPPVWQALWRHVVPIAMSRFGQDQLETLLGTTVPMIPHGVSEGFYQVSPERPGRIGDLEFTTKEECKAALNLGETFVLLRTDRLVPRKNYPALFRTMAPVLDGHPDRRLVIHCAPLDEGGDMAEFMSHISGSFEVNDRWRHPQVRFTGDHDTFRGYSDERLNILYNAADIYASPTKSEGFGLTLAEAAACGVPVITTDYAAGPEAVGAGAVLIPPSGFVTSEQAHDWALVDEPQFTAATVALASDPGERQRIGQLGIEHTSHLTWDATADAFLSLMG